AKFGYDDSLDVVGVHGIGGTWGALATGLFASKAINPAGNDGLLFGNPGQLGVQFVAVVATWILAFVGTMIILSILKALMGLRVSILSLSTYRGSGSTSPFQRQSSQRSCLRKGSALTAPASGGFRPSMNPTCFCFPIPTALFWIRSPNMPP